MAPVVFYSCSKPSDLVYISSYILTGYVLILTDKEVDVCFGLIHEL